MAGMIFVWSARRSTIVEGGVVVVVPKRTWARYSRLCIAPSSAMLLRWLTRSRGGITWAKKETFPTHARIMPADRPQQLCGCCVHANRRIRYNRKDLKNVHILRRKAVRARWYNYKRSAYHMCFTIRWNVTWLAYCSVRKNGRRKNRLWAYLSYGYRKRH